MRWIINKMLTFWIKKERKRQVRLGYSRDSDERKGPVQLSLIARQFERDGKYIQALGILQAATEVVGD